MTGKIAIIGAGLIGQSWAIAFARGGHDVAVFDADQTVSARAHDAICDQCRTLAKRKLLGGQRSTEVTARIGISQSLEAAVDGAVHVQENTPEDEATKGNVFQALDGASPASATIASSTSALLPSTFTQGLAGAHRCLVAHPLNPPHLIPAVELVPGPKTSEQTIDAVVALLRAIGQNPIRTSREVDGFVMNRLQGALLDEAFALVEAGIASVEDVDVAMRDGLARRWVIMGPFETIHLNAPGGAADFMDRYGPTYARIGAHRPNRPRWEGALRETVVAAQKNADHASRTAWRDARLAALAGFLEREED